MVIRNGLYSSCCIIWLLATVPFGSLYAGSKEDLAEMQRRLNAEVMAQPFSVEEES